MILLFKGVTIAYRCNICLIEQSCFFISTIFRFSSRLFKLSLFHQSLFAIKFGVTSPKFNDIWCWVAKHHWIGVLDALSFSKSKHFNFALRFVSFRKIATILHRQENGRTYYHSTGPFERIQKNLQIFRLFSLLVLLLAAHPGIALKGSIWGDRIWISTSWNSQESLLQIHFFTIFTSIWSQKERTTFEIHVWNRHLSTIRSRLVRLHLLLEHQVSDAFLIVDHVEEFLGQLGF